MRELNMLIPEVNDGFRTANAQLTNGHFITAQFCYDTIRDGYIALDPLHIMVDMETGMSIRRYNQFSNSREVLIAPETIVFIDPHPNDEIIKIYNSYFEMEEKQNKEKGKETTKH